MTTYTENNLARIDFYNSIKESDKAEFIHGEAVYQPPSTEKIDREIKFRDYAQHGVKEYWIIDPDKETIEQYELKDKQFELLVKVKSGSVASKAIDGFLADAKDVFK
jgi:hypothetical protein